MNLVVFLIGFGVASSLDVPGRFAPVGVFGIVVLARRAVHRRRQREEHGENPGNSGCVEAGLIMALLPLTSQQLTKADPLIFFLVVLALVLVGAAFLAWHGHHTVPAEHIGIVRRVHGASHPEFRHITPYNTRGVLARTLLPDRSSWLMPKVYEIEFVPRTRVAEDKIGLVTAKAGRIRSANRSLALPVACDNFQNGQAFLLNGGEQGKQVDTLAHGQSYDINTKLFEVKQVDRVHVPPGTIGLVTAKAGRIRPPGRLFSPHVECENFQNGGQFLVGGGEQGRQLTLLQGGAYYNINPALFEVVTVDNVRGQGGN